MNIKTLGIDLAKRSFQLHGVDGSGKTVLRKKLERKELGEFIVNLPKCLVLMEACATSHYWGRKFKGMGHEVKLIAAQFVKPFVKSQKNDRNDAEGIVECGLRPSMRFVAVKESWQQDIQVLHRGRRRAVSAKTAIINQVKGLLLEYGVVVEEKSGKFRIAALEAIEDAENDLTSAMRLLIQENLNEYDFLVNQIAIFEKEIKKVAQTSEDCQRLLAVPGVGVLGATAFIASVGDAKIFKNGRHVGSWLGLVPKQHSTGGKPKLLSITKRGDPELRALLIHGARASLLAMRNRKIPPSDHLSKWALELLDKKGWGKASVALANKMARIMWSLMAHKETYQAM
jgi:transposase